MNRDNSTKFDVIVDAERKGSVGLWQRKVVSVTSSWEPGSDDEKFDVLAGIRKIYNPEERADIRGMERQNPDQVARLEGFTELQYRRSNTPLLLTVIVKPLAGYSRLAANR